MDRSSLRSYQLSAFSYQELSAISWLKPNYNETYGAIGGFIVLLLWFRKRWIRQPASQAVQFSDLIVGGLALAPLVVLWRRCVRRTPE